jgi:hypothetical protein
MRIATQNINTSKKLIICGMNPLAPLRAVVSQRSVESPLHIDRVDTLGVELSEPKNTVYTSHGIFKKKNPISA